MHGKPLRMALGIVILLAVVGAALWRLAAPLVPAGDCDLSGGPCVLQMGEDPALLELEPLHPRPGEELMLRISRRGLLAEGWPRDGGEITFEMPGMKMGDHRMRLERKAPKVLEGRIALPACPMGHSLWRASIRVGDLPVFEADLHVEP